MMQKTLDPSTCSRLQPGVKDQFKGPSGAFVTYCYNISCYTLGMPGRIAQSSGHLTHKSAGVLGSIPGLATYFCFSFRFFKKGSCQLLVKVCAGSTG